MKKECKDLVGILSDNLEFNSLIFISKYLSSLEIDGDIINIIISAHLSSLFTLIRRISEKNEEAKRLVEDFIKNVIDAVEKAEAVSRMEVVENV